MDHDDDCQYCPCGGGQSCIVERRRMSDWVHEDDVLNQAKVRPRRHCHEEFDEYQKSALLKWWDAHNRPDSILRLETSSVTDPNVEEDKSQEEHASEDGAISPAQ